MKCLLNWLSLCPNLVASFCANHNSKRDEKDIKPDSTMKVPLCNRLKEEPYSGTTTPHPSSPTFDAQPLRLSQPPSFSPPTSTLPHSHLFPTIHGLSHFQHQQTPSNEQQQTTTTTDGLRPFPSLPNLLLPILQTHPPSPPAHRTNRQVRTHWTRIRRQRPSARAGRRGGQV